MQNGKQKIGIWGLGIVGKSAINYFSGHQDVALEVLDKKKLSSEDEIFLRQHNVAYLEQTENLEQFLASNDRIMPSPGIDLRPYTRYQHKWIAELDLFAQHFHKPIIAITGSVGKTSITHILSQILVESGLAINTGGNIGIGMLDLINVPCNAALLEVSSFQLELCRTFAPDLAIITNVYPNHLDRHDDYYEYKHAKFNIFNKQRNDQKALMPYALHDEIINLHPSSTLYFFSCEKPTAMHDAYTYFYCQNGVLVEHHNNKIVPLISLAQLPPITFIENWIVICAALRILNISLEQTVKAAIDVPEHRLEKVASINGVDFYNDSKSTTQESTLAAVKKLQGNPLRLFLGGMSKGIDKRHFIETLTALVVHIYCFGKEAEMLSELCKKNGIAHSTSSTLEDAFFICTSHIKSGDIVLFSPGGASFDLFENYKKRGQRFKELVFEYRDKN